MQAALRLQATILPGHRIEVSSPELPVGATVDVTVTLAKESARRSMRQIAESVPPGPHLFGTWEEYERFLREERALWER